MGLDMYLHAEKYVSGWNVGALSPDSMFGVIREFLGDVPIADGSPHMELKLCVAYWRKANAIHGWFVDNCQGGVDDCRDAYVEREQLEELRTECQKVLASFSDAKDRLPTRAGFFFGGTEYDDSYVYDLTDTIKQLDAVLSCEVFKGDEGSLENMPWSFYYRSSW